MLLQPGPGCAGDAPDGSKARRGATAQCRRQHRQPRADGPAWRGCRVVDGQRPGRAAGRAYHRRDAARDRHRQLEHHAGSRAQRERGGHAPCRHAAAHDARRDAGAGRWTPRAGRPAPARRRRCRGRQRRAPGGAGTGGGRCRVWPAAARGHRCQRPDRRQGGPTVGGRPRQAGQRARSRKALRHAGRRPRFRHGHDARRRRRRRRLRRRGHRPRPRAQPRGAGGTDGAPASCRRAAARARDRAGHGQRAPERGGVRVPRAGARAARPRPVGTRAADARGPRARHPHRGDQPGPMDRRASRRGRRRHGPHAQGSRDPRRGSPRDGVDGRDATARHANAGDATGETRPGNATGPDP